VPNRAARARHPFGSTTDNLYEVSGLRFSRDRDESSSVWRFETFPQNFSSELLKRQGRVTSERNTRNSSSAKSNFAFRVSLILRGESRRREQFAVRSSRLPFRLEDSTSAPAPADRGIKLHGQDRPYGLSRMEQRALLTFFGAKLRVPRMIPSRETRV